MADRLVIDQSLIQAPQFPRPLEWWAKWTPCWITPHLDDTGRVVMEPNGLLPNGRQMEMTAAMRRRHLAQYRQMLAERPRFAPAIVPNVEGDA